MELGILIVLGRFLIALPLGIAAGFGNSLCKSVINLFNILFSAIPALIISILVLKLSFFLGLFKTQSIIAFVIVLTAVGWAKLAGIIRERVQNILSQPFITGEEAIGKSKMKIAIENVLPHLSPELTVLFFMEIALALSMIMQLGIFVVYVGNLRVLSGTDSPVVMNISYEPEWASMLSSSIGYIKTAPWTVLVPALTFFISILGFNLVGEGLRERLQSKHSKFIIFFRKLLTLRIFTRKFVKITALSLSFITLVIASQAVLDNIVEVLLQKKR
jgi:peptide/nickel transport system permease protein